MGCPKHLIKTEPDQHSLKKISHAIKGNRGKWAPNYEWPFVVKRAFSGGALVLTNMDGGELPSPVNSDVVMRYYA